MDRSSQHLPQHLQVTIKRVDVDLPLPTYATEGSVGFDLLCREDTEIAPRTIELIPGNVIVRCSFLMALASSIRIIAVKAMN